MSFLLTGSTGTSCGVKYYITSVKLGQSGPPGAKRYEKSTPPGTKRIRESAK